MTALFGAIIRLQSVRLIYIVFGFDV